MKWNNSTFLECEENHGITIIHFYIHVLRNSVIIQRITTPTALGFASKLVKMDVKPR